MSIDGAGSGQICHTGDCACGSDVHLADFAGCCCDFATCIHDELAICALDGTISLESCLCRISCITAGIETVFVHDSTIQAHFDALIAEGNLVVPAFVQDHFCDVGLPGSYIAIGINGGGILLEDVFIAQADAAVHSSRQSRISTNAGCFFRCVSICAGLGFIGISCIQSIESICHVLINGIDTLYQIVIDLLDHLVLRCICAKASSRFIIQSLAKSGHVLTNRLVLLHDTGIFDFQLTGQTVLAHVPIFRFILQVFFYRSNTAIQLFVLSFTLGPFIGKF